LPPREGVVWDAPPAPSSAARRGHVPRAAAVDPGGRVAARRRRLLCRRLAPPAPARPFPRLIHPLLVSVGGRAVPSMVRSAVG